MTGPDIPWWLPETNDKDYKIDMQNHGGCYMRICGRCKFVFFGYERRVQCNTCSVSGDDTKPYGNRVNTGP